MSLPTFVEEELVAGLVPEHPAEAALTETETVVGCGVEVPDSQRPRLLDGRVRGVVVDLPVEVADRGASESESAHVVQALYDGVLQGHPFLLVG